MTASVWIAPVQPRSAASDFQPPAGGGRRGHGDSAFYFAAAVAPSSFGLGPRLRAWRRRRVLVSSAARNASEPTGRPTLSPLRRRAVASRPRRLPGGRRSGKSAGGRGEVGQAVLGEAQKGARARPRPVFGPRDETGAHGIEVHVAVGGGEMVLVHRHGAVSSLPEMAGSPPPRVDQSGISTMHARQGAAQAVFVLRDEDEMDVVGHQTPRPNAHPRFVRRLGQPVAIGGVVADRRRTPAGGRCRAASHGRAGRERRRGRDEPSATLAAHEAGVNLLHCHRNPCAPTARIASGGRFHAGSCR